MPFYQVTTFFPCLIEVWERAALVAVPVVVQSLERAALVAVPVY